MIIERSTTEFKFRFEPKDWAIGQGEACRNFLRELKEIVPFNSRSFDSATNTWTIEASYTEAVFYDLRKKYFADDRQQALF